MQTWQRSCRIGLLWEDHFHGTFTTWDKRPVQAFYLARESHDFEVLFSGSPSLSIFEALNMELTLKSKIKL